MKGVKAKIINETRKYPVPTKRLVRLATLVISGEGRTGSVNIIMVGDRRMRTLNSAFRRVDSTTDVLSFCYDAEEGEKPPPLIGEIFISVPQAAKRARATGHELSDEILFLASHGLLHVAGHTHESVTRFNRMIDKQVYYLNKLLRE